MTLFARNLCVQADQRKSAQLVIEADLLLPRGLIVTVFALGAELALMRILRLVTRNTGCLKFHIENTALMAAVACGFPVGAL